MEFFDILVAYETALWNAVDDDLGHHGLVGLGQLHALRMIDRRQGQARVQDLSDDLQITVGAVSKLVDRLERDRLAERQPNPANRRSSLVLLTDGGRQALTEGVSVARAVLDRALQGEDVEQLTAALGRLRTQIATRAARDVA